MLKAASKHGANKTLGDPLPHLDSLLASSRKQACHTGHRLLCCSQHMTAPTALSRSSTSLQRGLARAPALSWASLSDAKLLSEAKPFHAKPVSKSDSPERYALKQGKRHYALVAKDV